MPIGILVGNVGDSRGNTLTRITLTFDAGVSGLQIGGQILRADGHLM